MMNALERRSTFALSSIFALRMLGLFMIIPVFSVAGQSYQGATPALIGLAVGVYGLTQAILQIPFSLLADRFSRKPLVVLGLLLFALGGAVAAMSESIYGVIIGRAIAGGGAVSAVVMALLADITREEQRSKAMAVMGMSIGVSFMVAFSLGPWLTSLVGISGLFWVTTIMGLAAISMLLLVPKVTRHHRNYQQGYVTQLKQVLKMGDLNRLHISVFCAAFIAHSDVYLHAITTDRICGYSTLASWFGVFTFTGDQSVFCFSQYYFGGKISQNARYFLNRNWWNCFRFIGTDFWL